MIRRYSFPGLMLLINLFLVRSLFFPTADDIGMWDEAAYLHKGQVLLDQGAWPVFAENPLTSVFYALTYLPFRTSPIWMMQSDGLGRLLSFILVWVSAWLISLQVQSFLEQEGKPEALRSQAWLIPPVVMGLMLTTPVLTSMFPFPSDLLFTGLAGLSFWQLLTYLNSGSDFTLRREWHVWAASGLLGLAALARNDGMVLFPILVLLVGIVNFPLRFERGWWQAFTGALLPFALLVGGYIAIYGAFTGNYSPGIAERTYENFEAGHGIIYGAQGELVGNIENMREARRVFGTTEENGGSVLRAIQRNPRVYFERLLAFFGGLPPRLLRAYGINFAGVLLLLALRGGAVLIQTRQIRLLLVLSLWSMHLLSSLLITLIREGHFKFIFFLVFVLAALGLAMALEDWLVFKRGIAWIVVLVGVSAVSYWDNKLAVFYSAAVFLLAMTAAWLLRRRAQADPPYPDIQVRTHLQAALLVLLGAGLVLHGSFPSPILPDQAQGARVEAVTYLSQNFPPGTSVAAAIPGPVWMAKLNYLGLSAADVPLDDTPEEFLAWMKRQGIQVVYVDSSLYNDNPVIWRMIEPQVGKGLQQVKTFGEGDIQILIIR